MLRKKGSELACQMRELDVSFQFEDGFALLSVGVTIASATALALLLLLVRLLWR